LDTIPTANSSTDRISFANDFGEDETDLEVISSSSSQFLQPIAPKPYLGPWPANWVPEVQGVLTSQSNQFG